MIKDVLKKGIQNTCIYLMFKIFTFGEKAVGSNAKCMKCLVRRISKYLFFMSALKQFWNEVAPVSGRIRIGTKK